MLNPRFPKPYDAGFKSLGHGLRRQAGILVLELEDLGLWSRVWLAGLGD